MYASLVWFMQLRKAQRSMAVGTDHLAVGVLL